jgi:Fe-S cluster biogenesis protein NfuA
MGWWNPGQISPVPGGEDDLVDSEQDTSGTTAETDEATAAATEVSDEERADRLAQLNSIIELMRPAVQADGGDLALLSADVVSGVVEVQLQGSCSSCAISASTLQGGVDRILHDRLPWVTEVIGGVDETADPFESEALGRGGYVPSF